MNEIFLTLLLLLFGPQTEDKNAATPAPAPSAAPVAAASDPARPALTVGKTNTESGEARRNENIQFSQIDNNAEKELAQRMGTSATVITEMKSERSYFGAEYGGSAPGALHPAALRGSPGMHGSLFATHGDSALMARSFFQVGGVRPARDNQYGLSLGSGLWKGAFLSADGGLQQASGYVNGNVLVPLDNERTPRVADPAAARLIQRFIDAYPLERPNRTDIDRRALNTNARQNTDSANTSVQLDQKAGANDRLNFRHTFANSHIDAFQLVGGQNPLTTTRSHTARLSWIHNFSPRTQLLLTAGFDRNTTLLALSESAVGPQVQIGTSYEKLGPQNNIPLDRVQNRFRYGAGWTRRSGNHNLSAGGELARMQFNSYEINSNRGNYFFRADFGRDAITNFLEGRASRYSGAIGDPQRHHRGWDPSLYLSDDWKVRANLTLSFGLRYTPVIGLSELRNLDVLDYSCDCNNVGPRFGFAYRLPKSYGVIRLAWGMHFGQVFPTTLQQNRANPPNFQKFEVQAPDLLNPARDIVFGPAARAIVATYPSYLQAPYTHLYNFSWEGVAPGGWRIQTGYVGSRSRKLLILWHLNRARLVAGIPQTTATIQERRPDLRYFDYRRVENGANSYFDAGRVSAIAPNWHGLTLDASYWMSKAIDTGASYLNTAAGDDAKQGYSQTVDQVTSDLKGLSTFDAKHAVLVRLNYATPKIRRFDSIFGRWNLNSVFLAKSGLPFTVITGSDGPGSGNVDGVNGDRPNILDPSILGMAINHPDIFLPRAAFGLIQPTDPRGNIGVSTFRRGGIRNINASLGRSWTIAGEKKLSFRAESLNLFNTPQFAEPNPDLSSPAFGKITNTLNDGRIFRFQLRFSF
jgi:hypothetical protein